MGDAERARIREVFGAAIELAPAERPSFIEHACAGDSALLEQVQSLLTALEDAGEYLGSPSIGVLTAPGERPGALIGRYKLLEQIGEGGFGVVFLAEQREPVVRTVALKIIKLGMDTRQVIARFEAERQALAMMDHPNIARVLDAGATETGRPYFVMELVRGDTITAYCDRNKLTTRERLDLFTQVCQAVQHAHQKGVIHRDIKPSNVLITVADGKPIPKVIDFGIAKATSARLTETTLFTEHRALIGTPAYMSPEQAEMSGVDIDTRSDIYSLGVLLYELLTGTTPFDTKSLMAAGLAEIQRTIREVEPEKPSTRLSTLHAALPQGAQSAARRDIELGRRPESLRGDLDWIVMKALEKDRTRRYETANALAMEVERHLKNEPVLAGPPTRIYRFRKFAQRNRATVASAALVAVALLAGMAGTTFGLVRAEHRQAEAEQRGIEAEQRRVEAEAARGREREQRELAEKREKETRQVSDFQAAMLSGIDVRDMGRGIKERFRKQVQAALEHQYVGEPPDHRPRTPEEIKAEMAVYDQRANRAQAVDVARGVLDEFVLARAADSLKEEFSDQPLVQADLHFAIGIAYREIGLYGAAEPQLRAAMEIRQRELGVDDPDTLTSVSTTGYILWVQGNLDEAEPYYHRALDGRRRVLGNEDPATLGSINDMGELLVDQRPAEAKPFYDEALAGRRRLLGDDDPDTITSIHNMGFVLQALGRLDEAEPFYIEALERSRRVRGNEDPATLTSIHNMGFLLVAQGRLAEAEPFYLEALETARSVMGDDHPDLLSTINNLAGLLVSQDRLAEAETLYREALEKSRRLLGDDHPRTLGAIIGMGVLLQRQNKLPEAEAKFREGLETYLRVRGDEDIETLTAMHNLGFVLQAQGHTDEGERYYRKALATRQRVLGDGHKHTVISMNSLATLFQSQRKLAEADALFAKGTHAARAELGDHPITAMIEHHHADVLRELGRLGEAIELAQAAVDRYRANPDWAPSEAAHARRVLAAALSAAGRQAEALEVLWEMVQTERQRRGVTPAGLASVLAKFAVEATAAGEPAMLELAEEAARECLKIRQTVFPDGHSQVWLRYSAMSTLGQVLVAQAADPSLEVAARIERFRKAEPLLIQAWENMKDDPNVTPPSATGVNIKQVALERVVRLYEAWHAAEPDKGHDSRAAEKRAELEILSRL